RNPLLTKKTESETIIWDIGDKEEEYPFVKKYPSFKEEPIMFVEDESCPVYDTDNEKDVEPAPEYDFDGDELMYEDEKVCLLNVGESLVIQWVLNVAPSKSIDDDSWHWNNIFRTKCTSKGKVCNMIINEGSCENVVSTYMVEKLALKTVDYPEPYQLTCLKKEISLSIAGGLDHVNHVIRLPLEHEITRAPGVVKPESRGNVNFEIKSQFMRELREDTFFGNKNEDAHDHVDRVLNIGPILGMTPTQALIAIQTMADHSQKWHDRTSSRNVSNNNNTDRLAAIVSKLDILGCDMKKLKENVHAIQVGCQIYEGPHLDKECPLNEEVKQLEEVKYGEFGRFAPFNESNGAKFRIGPPGYYTRTDNRPPYGEKRPSLEEIMNKHQEEPVQRSARVNVMPKNTFKHLRLAKLRNTNMLVEMADMTKKAPLGIIENILVRINKFLFPLDFIIIDKTANETTILGMPFLATIHAEIDVFEKISLGVDNARVSYDMEKKDNNFTTPTEKIL
nr:putative reverse transcriptase domain-containing protein [Tanacetum cinerariifolium]